jgi:hypothetical protein
VEAVLAPSTPQQAHLQQTAAAAEQEEQEEGGVDGEDQREEDAGANDGEGQSEEEKHAGEGLGARRARHTREPLPTRPLAVWEVSEGIPPLPRAYPSSASFLSSL